MKRYVIEVDDDDAQWIDERLAARNRYAPNGYSLFITSSVPAVHMSNPITIVKQSDPIEDAKRFRRAHPIGK